MASALAHVMIVGGTRREWAAIDPAAWADLADEWGTVVADAGGAWLTIRAYEAGTEGNDQITEPDRPARTVTVAGGRCTAVIDPQSDGRERFAEAMRRLPAGAIVDEKTVTGLLYEPADVEPDLVLVLGTATRLPPSLVWELAYGELVFTDSTLAALRAADLAGAIAAFQGRRRRFGGLDT